MRRIRGAFPELPQTCLGFPVEPPINESELNHPDGSNVKPRLVAQRGVALLIAIMIISMMMLFASDLIITSTVQLSLAQTQRDNIKAEYIAKSGANLAILVITSDLAKDLYMAGPASPQKMDPGDSGISFWNALNALPPIGGTSSDMISEVAKTMGMNKTLDSTALDQLKLFDGDFKVEVTDEQNKINLNYCANKSSVPCSMVKMMAKALFSCPAEKQFLENKKLKPGEMAGRLADWVSGKREAQEESGLSDKNEPYQKRNPPHQTKDAPFDSLDELRMVDGWDEEMHAVFSPFFTVYPFPKDPTERPKINLSSSTRELLQCLFPDSRGEGGLRLIKALMARDEDGTALWTAGQKLPDVIRDLTGYAPQGAGGAGGGSGSPGDSKLDDGTDKSKWFGKSSQVYRISVAGNSGDTTKNLSMVVERTIPDPTKDQKVSYKILYYKLL